MSPLSARASALLALALVQVFIAVEVVHAEASNVGDVMSLEDEPAASDTVELEAPSAPSQDTGLPDPGALLGTKGDFAMDPIDQAPKLSLLELGEGSRISGECSL